jgi:hypothetical protein
MFLEFDLHIIVCTLEQNWLPGLRDWKLVSVKLFFVCLINLVR